jgi:hypothetical protein
MAIIIPTPFTDTFNVFRDNGHVDVLDPLY